MFGERLKSLRKAHNLNQTELGNMLGLSASSIGMYEQGRRDPDSENLVKLSEYFDVTVDYLLGLSSDKNKNGSNVTYLPTDIVRLPILGKISAGLPILAIENIESYELISRDSLKPGHEYFWLKVDGDSMNQVMKHNDNVLVQRQDVVQNGEIAIVMIDNCDATIKKFYKDGNMVTLLPMSNNPSHAPQMYDTREIEVRIIGKAVKITSNL